VSIGAKTKIKRGGLQRVNFVLYIAALLIIMLAVKSISFAMELAAVALMIGIVPQIILRKGPPLKYTIFVYLGTVAICMPALAWIGSDKEFQIFYLFLSFMSFAYVTWKLKKK